MRAHYLQHVPFEGLGSIENWLVDTGYIISSTQMYASAVLPDPKDIDFLVIMGGPMSVNEQQDFPWLLDEKRFIRQLIDAGTPTLGVCLGAQLIANVMGARVFPNPVKEIGWFTVQATKAGDHLPAQVPGQESARVFSFPDSVEVFHWHGETFDLPPGAVRIAENQACANQAFQLGRNVIGLQFHLETTPASADAIVENCRDELRAGLSGKGSEYIQSEADILAAPPESYREINGLMDSILAFIHGLSPCYFGD